MNTQNREVDDSLTQLKPKFKTKRGREVLGGGGITPDIHIVDDTYLSKSTQNILYSPKRIIFKYADNIKNQYSKLKKFSTFNKKIQNSMLNESDFFKWLNTQSDDGDEKKLDYHKDSLLLNWELINNRIQSEVAANLWGKDYRYYIRLHIDKQFQAALDNFDLAKSFVE